MAKINKNFLDLKGSYLFSDIAKKVTAFTQQNPQAQLIRLGIGDVTLPLPAACVTAMKTACDEMGTAETFRGYGPEQGYDFLRNAIAKNDYQDRGIGISAGEIFVSDGAKSDVGNIVDIFAADNIVALGDPVYPVYLDTSVMSGRAGNPTETGYDGIVYMPCVAENNFSPEMPTTKADLIYLCYPNNPTGSVASKDYLKKWVDYANKNGSIILYDSAYERFITSDDIPHSIFEIEGAKTCAIEFRSFSKTAGFTGTRCGFTVIPNELEREGVNVHSLWNRRQTTKFNGVSYIIQRGAEAVYSDEGKKQIKENIAYYMNNAKIIRESLSTIGLEVFGGEHAPYIWAKTPNNMPSWQFFETLLNEAHVVTTPGVGFGPSGEGYIRLTAFGNKENTLLACSRIKEAAKNW